MQRPYVCWLGGPRTLNSTNSSTLEACTLLCMYILQIPDSPRLSKPGQAVSKREHGSSIPPRSLERKILMCSKHNRSCTFLRASKVFGGHKLDDCRGFVMPPIVNYSCDSAIRTKIQAFRQPASWCPMKENANAKLILI